MPGPLAIVLVATLCLGVTARAEEKPSPAVTRILDEAVRAVKRNRVDFDKSNQKPLGEARKALEDLSTKLIKDGKADEAAAVLRQVGTLEADVMKMANAPAPVAGGGAVPQKPLLERMAGKWDQPTWAEYLEIRPDGVMRLITKVSGKTQSEGMLTLLKPHLAEVRFSDGSKRRLMIAGDDADAVLVYGVGGKVSAFQRAE